MKLARLVCLYFFIACGGPRLPEVDSARLEAFKANQDFVSLEKWTPKKGRNSQPKYLGQRRDGVKFVVKPQVPGADLMEIAYFAFKSLYGSNKYHEFPLQYGYDANTSILFVEFISCMTVDDGKEEGLWTESLDIAYKKYRKKIDELRITDLNEGNVVFCSQEERDPFYIIDLGLSEILYGKNIHALIKYISWYQGELPDNVGSLNYIGGRFW